MPELPEVETIKIKLKKLVIGKTIEQISVLRSKSFQGDTTFVEQSKVIDLTRRAKLIRFHLSNGYNFLVHLKMTGQLIFTDGDKRVGGGHPTADWVNSLPSKHTRIIFDLSDGAKLFFNDMRVFGWVKVMTNQEIEDEYKKYGKDIIDVSFTAKNLYDHFQRRSITVKQAIMMNSIVAGVGNIYACDALNLAKIDPKRKANSLDENEVLELLKASRAVIQRGIEMGGATIDDYVDVDGFSGKYQDVILAYGRVDQPCYNCGDKIVKTKIGGRGTYYCKTCQK